MTLIWMDSGELCYFLSWEGGRIACVYVDENDPVNQKIL